MPRHLAPFLAIVLLIGLACPACAHAAAPSGRVRKFLGDSAAAVLQGAARVEVFRLIDDRAEEGKPAVGRYAVKSAGKEQGEAFAKRLAAVLLDERTYVFGSAKGCTFDPGVGYRIWNGDGAAVEVVICFKCDELIVHSPKAADGSVRGAMEDFDPARPALVRLAKDAFPDDRDIQALVENK